MENESGLALMFLGDAMIGLGYHDRARAIFSECVRILKEHFNTSVVPYPLRRLGYEALRVKEWQQAAQYYIESMNFNLVVGDRQGVAASMVGLVAVAGDTGNWSEAARLLGAAEAVLESIQTQLLPFDRKQRDSLLEFLQAQPDKPALELLRQEGKTYSLEQAVQAARDLIKILPLSNQ